MIELQIIDHSNEMEDFDEIWGQIAPALKMEFETLNLSSTEQTALKVAKAMLNVLELPPPGLAKVTSQLLHYKDTKGNIHTSIDLMKTITAAKILAVKSVIILREILRKLHVNSIGAEEIKMQIINEFIKRLIELHGQTGVNINLIKGIEDLPNAKPDCIENELLNGLIIANATLIGLKLYNVQLNSAELIQLIAENTVFEKVNFSCANLNGSWFQACKFIKSNFEEALLNTNTVFSDCEFDNIDFSKVNIDKCKFPNCTFKNCTKDAKPFQLLPE
jgi:hypothetical protein